MHSHRKKNNPYACKLFAPNPLPNLSSKRMNEENSWIASNPCARHKALKSTVSIAKEIKKEEQCWKASWNSHRLSKQHTTQSDTQNWKGIACWPGLHAQRGHTTSASLFQLKKFHYKILVSQPALSTQVERLRAAGIQEHSQQMMPPFKSSGFLIIFSYQLVAIRWLKSEQWDHEKLQVSARQPKI